MKSFSSFLALTLFAVAMTVTAQKDSSSGGTNDVTQTGGAVTNGIGQIDGGSTNAPALTAPRPRVGVMHPQTLGSQPSSSVLVTPAVSSRAARWNVRGAANDWAPVDFGNWVFPHGTNHTSRFAVKTSGEVCAGNLFGERFTAVGAPMSAVPGLSTFDIFEDPDGRRFRWQDFALRRDTNNLVTAEILLKRNGDWIASSNGVVTVHERELPFDHDGWGQDAEWVAANFTNANEILSAGYANWVDDQVGFGEENGLYKLTVTVASAPPETVQLTVGDFAVAVTNAGEYAFLLEKGVPYELSVAPGWFADLFEYQMNDDIALPLMMSALPLLEEGGCWTLTKDQLEFDQPSTVIAPRTFGNCIWRPKLRVSPGNWIPTANRNREIFTASVTDLPWWTRPSFTWSTSDDSVISLSGTSGTQTVVWCDIAAARLRSATLTLRMSVGFDWMEAVFVAGGQSQAPTDGVVPVIAATELLFVNNDDDNADGVPDHEANPLNATDDDDVGAVRVEVPSGWDGTLRIEDGDFDVINGLYERVGEGVVPVERSKEWAVTGAVGRTVNFCLSSQYASPAYRTESLDFTFTPSNGVAYSAAARYTFVEPDAEPICSATTNYVADGVEHRAVLNPCGVGVGREAYFKVKVKPDDFPDERIVWTAEPSENGGGSVDFVGSGTGRTVRVRGVTPGDLTLKVRIGDVEATPPSFPLKVVTNTVTKLNVWIVANDLGECSRTTNEVYQMLQIVNDIYAQVGMSFYIDKIVITNCQAACDVNINGPATSRNMSDDQVAAFESNTGGLECYFIRSFANDDNTIGLNFRSGLLLTQKASATDWAHEIGHACGMHDIYCDRKTNSIPDAVRLKNEHVLWDMSGGSVDSATARYYESNARLTGIIRRLLMYGYGGGTDWIHTDISSGAVEGLDVDGVRGRCATSVFNADFTTRNPHHE